MHIMTRGLLLGCLLLSPFLHVSAQDSLPVAIPEGLDGALARTMTALMRDYPARLSGARVLQWRDPATFETRSWTPHLAAFAAACHDETQNCARLLQSQLASLRDSVDRAINAPRSELFAVTISALSDLCEAAGPLRTADGRIFSICNGQAGFAGFTALTWLELGFDELFSAYYGKHLQNINSTIAWLNEERADDRVAEAQSRRLAAQLPASGSAIHFETADKLSLATTAWLQALLEAMSNEDHAKLVGTSMNLARVSFALGDAQQGTNWLRLAESVLAEHPGVEASLGCGLRSTRARVDVARAMATGTLVDGALVVNRLIKQGCAYTIPAIEHAIASLRASRPDDAAATAALAIEACRPGRGCAASRVRHLEDLLVIARGRKPELLRESERWLAESRIGEFNGVERQIVWALADSLMTLAQDHDAGRRLYEALDEQIHAERSSSFGRDPSTIKNLARYDQLARARVKAAVQQGHVVSFERTESLRSQSLLRRLRIKRGRQEFADVRDDKASETVRARRLERTALLDAVAEWRDPGYLEPLRTALLSQAADGAILEEEYYLGELAARKAEAGGSSRRMRWLGLGGLDLAFHDAGRPQASSLDAEEGYLSWLRVPGGFVAVLAAPDPEMRGQSAAHRLLSRFVPLSSSMTATLELYRRLLQSGAGASRGLKAATPVSDGDALLLHGVPVWHLRDGSFIAAARAPTGAARSRSLADLSDAIFEWLLGSFDADLKLARRLVISPDAELSFLPFETLSNRGVPILDAIDISYVQSLAVHEELTTRAAVPKKNGPILLSMADPDYTVTVEPSPASDALPLALTDLKWSALPGTAAESAELVRLFPGARQWLGARASRRQLNELQASGELGQYRVLHFATHGYVDDERSALVLSTTDGPVQSYLQDTDVLELNLGSDLVILSACDTGLGRSVSGEGVMGLPYAFLLAGNSNTLMSLWPVDDKGTAAFVSVFMAKVQAGSDLLAALNHTKREFASGRHGKAFSDPRIWAAFVQYGVSITLVP